MKSKIAERIQQRVSKETKDFVRYYSDLLVSQEYFLIKNEGSPESPSERHLKTESNPLFVNEDISKPENLFKLVTP